MNDCVGTDNLVATSSSYATDQNGLASDAIQLGNIGYATAPSDIYFSSALTITLWTKASSCVGGSGSWCRLLDFGSGTGVYNVFLSLKGSNGGLKFVMYDESNNPYVNLETSYVLSTSWAFVAVTYDGYTATFYVNGASIGSSTSSTLWVPPSFTRTLS